MDANQNFFALLGDDENEDPTPAVVAKYAAPSAQKPTAKKQEQKPPLQQASAKLPTKPLPPAEAVRVEREAGRGRGVRSGRGRGRSFGESYGSDRQNESYGSRGRGGRGGHRGYGETAAAPEGERSYEGGRGRGRRGGFGRGFDGDEDQKRGTGQGEDVATQEEVKTAAADSELKVPPDVQQEGEQTKEEEEDDNEMTLDEYEKILEEKRKALEALKTEERKVQADNDFKAMQLVDKKNEDDVFIKLSSDKEKLKKKESAEKDERMKKAMSINEFLKPAEGDKYSPRGGRGGMRGGRGRGSFGRYNSGYDNGASTPSIEDPQQFPELGKK